MNDDIVGSDACAPLTREQYHVIHVSRIVNRDDVILQKYENCLISYANLTNFRKHT